MYFWKTNALSEDIKSDILSDKDWKQYYLAGSIFITLSVYMLVLFPRVNMLSVAIEAVAIISIIIFGVSITFNTNQKSNGNGENYIARMTALSFPILIKLFVLSLLFGLILGIVGELSSLSLVVQEWVITLYTILI
jgi:hypothetical protein